MATQRNFANLGNNTYLLIEKIASNQRICRLLEYSVKNPFSKEYKDIDGINLINERICVVPKVINEDALKKSTIIAQFDNFITSSNPEFKITSLRFDIVCPYSLWTLEDTSLRPFLLMQEIDTMFNGARLQNIGVCQFSNASLFTVDENIGGYTMTYKINEFN